MGGPEVVSVGVGFLVFVGVGVGVGVGDRVGVGLAVVGAIVVGATVVGATGEGDCVLLVVGLADGLSTGSGSSPLLNDAHRAPPPSPSTIAATTAMMIGVFDGFFSVGSGSPSPAGGIAMVG